MVHFEAGSKRHEVYEEELRDGLRPGYAAADGAALHFIDTEMVQVIASRPEARAYRLELRGDRPKDDPDRHSLSGLARPHSAGRRIFAALVVIAARRIGLFMSRRLLVMGGHEFDRLDGNEAICDHILELTGKPDPRICLLPTASGDPEDQISRFRRSFGSRGCEVSDISLFRLGHESDRCERPSA